jgi:hypothetical protein
MLAMLLAITGLGGSNAGKEAINNNGLASDYFTFFQAKSMRHTSFGSPLTNWNSVGQTIPPCQPMR